MPYHTTGSMFRRSFSGGGGYGTIKISLQDFGELELGDRVRYLTTTGQVPTDHGFVDVYKMDGELFLIDPQYTIDSPNPPPFQSGDTIIVDELLQTTIASVENISADEFNPIVEINLDSPIVFPPQFVYKFGDLAGEPYYGPYHKHQDGTLMIKAGVLNVIHALLPEEIIVPRDEFDYDAFSEGTATSTFEIDENIIKETFSDLVYTKWFSSLDNDYASNNTFFDMTQGGEEVSIDLNLNTLQTTIRDGQITTGRSDDEQLVFFKKDRNTPENRKDLTDGKLSLVINNISSSFVDNGVVDLSEFISDKISVVSELSPDEDVVTTETISQYGLENYMSAAQNMPENFKIKNINYKLRYRNGQVKIDVPFGDLLHIVNIVGTPNSDDYLRQWYYYEWVNVLNLSQLTTPSTGQKINPTKAREILDTNIFELLPPQSTQQTRVDNFFQEFNELIGPEPGFQDVDNDGVGESVQNETEDKESRISFENKRGAFITRLDSHTEDNNGVRNVGKTLETMRNRLNNYLGDVDNVVQEIQDQRPIYENKANGFLKIRKPNQAIILRAPDNGELEFQKNNSYLNDGFTITMWVRFVSKTSEGTLFNFGNPLEEDGSGIRLETRTNVDGDGNYRRWIRLAVREQDGTLRDNHWGTPQRDRRTVNQDGNTPGVAKRYPTDNDGNLLGYTSNVIHELYPQILTDNLDEWYFICATYNPNIEELNLSIDDPLRNSKQYWLNHYDPNKPNGEEIVANSELGARCKVEIISKSELLTARGFLVDSLQINVPENIEEQETQQEESDNQQESDTQQQTQQQTQQTPTVTLSGTLSMPSPDASVWAVTSVNNNNLAQQVEAGMTVTLLQYGQTQNFIIESISGNTVNLTEPVPGQSIGSTIEFFVEIELEDEQESDEPAPM